MSMNKFMHSRNIYKTPPDFKQLAIENEEFRNISKMNMNGTIHINFKNEKALRILTQCLLKKDFNLNVTLPESKLIPTLPLRLNYILWIEDIMHTFKLKDVIGIDIGCGASCIYPILAVRQNANWQMFATELNEESAHWARQNIDRNNLTEKVELITNCNADEPFAALDSYEKFHHADFTMCNPPFFNDEHFSCDGISIGNDSSFKLHKNRTGKRKQANNAMSGSGSELVTSGGEVNFVQKMITNSRAFSERIKIFTSMLGHKISVTPIQTHLIANGITNFCTTEFCQGRTTRWGIAWTFQNDLLLRTVPITGLINTRKTLTFFVSDETNVEITYQKLLTILNNLENSEITTFNNDGNIKSFHFIASTNSWSKQRQKRRKEAAEKVAMATLNQTDCGTVNQKKRLKLDENYESSENNTLMTDKQSPPLLHIKFTVEKDLSIIEIKLDYLNGIGNQDCTYQLLQFIRNKWQK